MVQSMTGFATTIISLAKNKNQKIHASLSLKALNSRYFEVHVKLPPLFTSLETEFIKLFKKTLYRGSIYVTVHVDDSSFFKRSVEPAMHTIHDYIRALTLIKKECGIKSNITLETIIRLPNIFKAEEHSLDKKTIQTIITTAKNLISMVIKEREREGIQLKKDLERRIAFVKEEIAFIEKRSHKHIAEQKEKLSNLLEKLEGDNSSLSSDRKNAFYTVLDKIDIHEEIIRFQSHLENIILLLNNSIVEKGKRLDFTLQELAREINTITAKCNDIEISKRAINIKVEIEKAREQTQNIV